MRHAIGDAHFKRRTCLVVVAFLASGCLTNHIAPVVAQSTPDIATIKAERDALTRAYVLCMAKSAKRLDDKKSDPGTIAHAIIASCSAEFNADVEAHSRYLEDGLEGRAKVEKSLREVSYGSAIQLVLENRRAGRR